MYVHVHVLQNDLGLDNKLLDLCPGDVTGSARQPVNSVHTL